MRIDALMVASGALSCVEASEVAAVLEAAAYDFLHAGGRVTIGEYSALSDESRAALRRAQERRDGEIAARVLDGLVGAMDAARGEQADETAQDAAEAMLGGIQ